MPARTEGHMGKSGDEAGGRLRTVVAEARARLGRAAGRTLLLGRWPWAIGAGAAAAMSRPVLWRIGEEAPLWSGSARAALLFAAGSALAAGALVVAGRRRGPSEVGAARALDEALGTPEVVASGFAFARDGRAAPLAVLARRRAEEAAAGARVEALFPLPSLRPGARAVGRFAGALLIALAVGSYDPAVATALAAPPSAVEREAAAGLEDAAAEVAAEEKKEAKKPAADRSTKARDKSEERLGSAGPALADKARQAARAARRGDRKAALEKIEELHREGQARSARAGDLGKALRKVAEALAPPGAEKAGGGGQAGREGSPSAAESTRLLADKLKSPEGKGEKGEKGEGTERTLERLERAAEEARRAASENGSKEAAGAARALSRAAADLKRGDREAASAALAEAAQRMASMEQAREAARREAEAIAEMLERSGMLERAVQAAMLGREGEGQGEKGEGLAKGEGEGEKGEGKRGGKPGAGAELRAAILARLVAMGAAEPKSFDQPGTGPHLADRQRSKRAALPVEGSIKAPSQMGDGPRAIQAVQGLGRGTEPPKEYREVFPSYDAAAEEGLADERVPAQRRAAVRRYFQAIRPE